MELTPDEEQNVKENEPQINADERGLNAVQGIGIAI
jgi:hypothetical protein